MTANEPTTPKPNRTNDNADAARWQHSGTGSLEFRTDHTAAGVDDVDMKAILHPPREGTVRAAIVANDDTARVDPSGWADIDMTPDAAEALARDLIECAAVAREQQE